MPRTLASAYGSRFKWRDSLVYPEHEGGNSTKHQDDQDIPESTWKDVLLRPISDGNQQAGIQRLPQLPTVHPMPTAFQRWTSAAFTTSDRTAQVHQYIRKTLLQIDVGSPSHLWAGLTINELPLIA